MVFFKGYILLRGVPWFIVKRFAPQNNRTTGNVSIQTIRSHSTKHDRLWKISCKGVVNDSTPVNMLIDGREREREVQWTCYGQITRLAQCCFDRRWTIKAEDLSRKVSDTACSYVFQNWGVNKLVIAFMNILARRSRHVLTLSAITSFYEPLRLASFDRRLPFNSESSCVACQEPKA
jgi:hypothetical protein